MSGIVGEVGSKSNIIGEFKNVHQRLKVPTAVPEGLVAWYRDGGLQDFYGGLHGTLQDSLAITQIPEALHTGPWGSDVRSASRYNATSGYVALPVSPWCYPQGNHARTYTMWVKPNGSLDNADYLFGFGTNSTGQTFNARCGSNKLSFMGYGRDHDGYGSFSYSIGNWVRIWYTYDGTTVRTYTTTNGNVTLNWDWAASLNTGTTLACIGAHAASPTNNDTDASIRDFRIYNRQLSIHEMGLMWNE